LHQSDLPPQLFLPVSDEDRNLLFEALGIPIELVNDRLHLNSKFDKKTIPKRSGVAQQIK